MKYLFLILAFTSSNIFAIDLLRDNFCLFIRVPAIKVKNELQSCTLNGWKVIKNQGKDLSGEYICSQSGSWNKGGPMQEVKVMGAQEIAEVHVGNVKAVGMNEPFEIYGRDSYTSNKKEMLLFFEFKQ